MNVEIEIDKSAVYLEVEKITGYTGAKATDDESAYLRIATTGADKTMLQSFWDESLDAVSYALRRNLLDIVHTEDSTCLCLVVSAAFDTSVLPMITSDITHFMANNITGRWFGIVNPAKAADYSATASTLLENAVRKLHLKKKPTRPNYC